MMGIRCKTILAAVMVTLSLLGGGGTLIAGESFITAPLPLRNMYPPMMRFLDPVPDSALRDYSDWDVGLHQHLSSIYQADQWPASQLLADMELSVTDLMVRKALTEDMDLSVQLSLLRPFNGVLDQLVKDVHKILGVPSSGRQFRANNAFGYYFRPGSPGGWQGKNRWEMGNAVVSLRKQLLEGDGWAVAGLASVKASTASSSRGFGSGKPDVGAGAVASFAGERWFMHVEAWAIYTFARDVAATALPGISYHPYSRGSATLGWKYSDQLALIVQGQGGSSPYSSGIRQLDKPPLIYSFGLQGETDGGTGWTLAFTENGLSQHTTQDFTLSLAMHWQFPG